MALALSACQPGAQATSMGQLCWASFLVSLGLWGPLHPSQNPALSPDPSLHISRVTEHSFRFLSPSSVALWDPLLSATSVPLPKYTTWIQPSSAPKIPFPSILEKNTLPKKSIWPAKVCKP